MTKGSLFGRFASLPWQGEDALHTVLRAGESVSMNVVKVGSEDFSRFFSSTFKRNGQR